MGNLFSKWRKRRQVSRLSTAEDVIQKHNQIGQVRISSAGEQATQESVPPICVAAIDFGATFTGYAFMCRGSEDKLDMENIEGREWHAERWMRQKTQTSVLFDEDEVFYNFGYPAESFYSDQFDIKDHNMDKWHFFQNLKMDITEEQDHLDEKYMVYDIRKKNRMKAIDVITEIIKYLKGDLVKTITQRVHTFEESDVQWILTFPVIWNVATRTFFRKAAIMAGIPNHQLTLLLEPEAAALYCEHKELDILRGKDGQRFLSKLPLNSKFLVVDLGGGTIDITVHKRGQGNLEYKDKALGLKWGGKKVNESFEEYCVSMFGQCFNELKRKHPDDYLYLMETFEHEKIKFNVHKLNKGEIVRIRLPASLSEKDKLDIQSDLFRSFYDIPINGLIDKLYQLLKSDVNEMQDINLILVVGGFAESSIVISELKSKFSNFDIVVPEKPGLAVMHGAVLFGFLKYSKNNNEGTERHANPLRHRSDSDAKKVKHFLSEVIGREVMNKMSNEQLNQLVEQFQDKIFIFKNGNIERDSVVVTLPFELRELYTKQYIKTLEDGLQKFNDDVSCKKDKLIITLAFFRKYFL